MTVAYGVGGGSTDVVANLKVILAEGTAANNYATFHSPLGTPHEVGAGKILVITMLHVIIYNAAHGFRIGYGDDSVADGAAAPTNWVQQTQNYVLAVANNLYKIPTHIPILAGKFPCMRAYVGKCTITAYGIEATP